MSTEFSRRDFHRLTAAAVGGILAGSTLGCSDDKAKPKQNAPGGSPSADTKVGDGPASDNKAGDKGGPELKVAAVNDWMGATHVCRGLNACKNQGKKGTTNDCAGQGACHTIEKEHGCGGENACKFQGGCGKAAGQNECKTKGDCHIPLMDSAWKGARTAFEAAMTKANKKFGKAPEPKS